MAQSSIGLGGLGPTFDKLKKFGKNFLENQRQKRESRFLQKKDITKDEGYLNYLYPNKKRTPNPPKDWDTDPKYRYRIKK